MARKPLNSVILRGTEEWREFQISLGMAEGRASGARDALHSCVDSVYVHPSDDERTAHLANAVTRLKEALVLAEAVGELNRRLIAKHSARRP